MFSLLDPIYGIDIHFALLDFIMLSSVYIVKFGRLDFMSAVVFELDDDLSLQVRIGMRLSSRYIRTDACGNHCFTAPVFEM